jgi:phosphoribosylformylglycinamidine synthase
VPDASRAGRAGFAQAGDAIALVGPFAPSAAGSELAKLRGEAPEGPLPALDPVAAAQAHDTVRELVQTGRARSAHDIAEGGIAVALAECCVAGEIGAEVELPDGLEPFDEAPGQGFIVSGDAEHLSGLPIIGRVGGDTLELRGVLNLAVSELRDLRESGLAELV